MGLVYVAQLVINNFIEYLRELAEKYGLCCYREFYEALEQGDWKKALEELFKKLQPCQGD